MKKTESINKNHNRVSKKLNQLKKISERFEK